jgi:small subunit ribosomal protein S4
MARYSGALCRLCRREGVKLHLKGKKCDTAKCMLERRNFAPGQHGKSKGKLSEYGTQLREKQKLRRIYGIGERQFALYFGEASRRKGITGDALLQILETRLDNVVYRLGFTAGLREARQVVRHGHVRINDKKVNIPSFRVKAGDSVIIKETGTSRKFVGVNMEVTSGRPIPEWMSIDKEHFKGSILRLPDRKDINIPVNENMIVELYSK